MLSTVLSILETLGMVDKRTLVFAAPEEQYDSRRMVVIFKGKDRYTTISCAISREALEDHFENDNKSLISIFTKNREYIEHLARRKYLAGQRESDGSILIKTEDLA